MTPPTDAALADSAAAEQRHRAPRKRRKKRSTQTPPGSSARPEMQPVDPAPSGAEDACFPPPPPVPDRQPQDGEFSRLGLADRLLHGVEDLGFETCTPIQARVLPESLRGQDVLGQAQTGSGKTAAFLLTVFQRLETTGAAEGKPPRSLVLAPTRELVIQIAKDAGDIGKYSDLRVLAVYGGMGFNQQEEALKQAPDVIVATPGRLLDFLRRGAVSLSDVEILVIDEADRMLDMGFIPDVRTIVRRTPAPGQRQTLFFSATLTDEVERLAASWTREPVRVEIAPEHLVPAEVDQRVYALASDDKLALLLWLLKHEAGERVLVFRNRRNTCERLVRDLLRYGVNCAILTGDVPQQKRLRVLEAFRKGTIRVVVATDVAGRGIHVDNISHVVNYDLPYEPEDYVHRVGRTGRAGTKGQAISFACEEGGFFLPDIEELLGQALESDRPEPEMLKLPHPAPRVGGKQHADVNTPKRRPTRRRRPRGSGNPRGSGPRN